MGLQLEATMAERQKATDLPESLHRWDYEAEHLARAMRIR
jgi:hypothetical protein